MITFHLSLLELHSGMRGTLFLLMSNANLTVGKKYWILVSCTAKLETTSINGSVRLLHGSTPFPGSTVTFESRSGHMHNYLFSIVWTAVASEDIKLQIRSIDNSAFWIEADEVVMNAINLSDDLTEGEDWFFAENATAATLTTTFGGNGQVPSITIDSADHADGDRYLVVAVGQIDPDDTTNNYETRIERSGEASDTDPLASQEGENVLDIVHQCMMKVFALGAASNTFATQSRRDAGADGGTKEYGSVFAINLEKFNDPQITTWTKTQSQITNSIHGSEVLTKTFTPDIAGDYLILANVIFTTSGAGFKASRRLQIDQTDTINQTTHAYLDLMTTYDGDDRMPTWETWMEENMSATEKILDVDMGTNVNTMNAEERQMVIISMELAGGAPPAASNASSCATVIG